MNKDIMYYIKGIYEVIMILTLIICAIGSIFCYIAAVFGYQWPCVFGWFVGIGFVNLLIMLSVDANWRRDYYE